MKEEFDRVLEKFDLQNEVYVDDHISQYNENLTRIIEDTQEYDEKQVKSDRPGQILEEHQVQQQQHATRRDTDLIEDSANDLNNNLLGAQFSEHSVNRIKGEEKINHPCTLR